MARKTASRNKQSSLLDKLNKLKDNLGGDLPWMADCKPDVWHDLLIDVASIDEHDDAGPDGKWSCYRFEGAINGGDDETIEVPFWTMTEFITAVVDCADEMDDKVECIKLQYKRSFDGNGRNTGAFQ